MRARLLLRAKATDAQGDLTEMVVWEVPVSDKQLEGVRYRLAFIPQGAESPAVLYDNHHPKGHHKHLGGKESAYGFSNVSRLIEDFDKDILRWKRERRSQ